MKFQNVVLSLHRVLGIVRKTEKNVLILALPILFLASGCHHHETPATPATPPETGIPTSYAPYTRSGTNIKINFLNTADDAFSQRSVDRMKAVLDGIPTAQLQGIQNIQASATPIDPSHSTLYGAPADDPKTGYSVENRLTDQLSGRMYESGTLPAAINAQFASEDPTGQNDLESEFMQCYQNWIMGGASWLFSPVPTINNDQNSITVLENSEQQALVNLANGLMMAALFTDPATGLTTVFDPPQPGQLVQHHSAQIVYSDQPINPGDGGYISVDGIVVATLNSQGQLQAPSLISGTDAPTPPTAPLPTLFANLVPLTHTPPPGLAAAQGSTAATPATGATHKLSQSQTSPGTIVEPDGSNSLPQASSNFVGNQAPSDNYIPLTSEKAAPILRAQTSLLNEAQKTGSVPAATAASALSHEVTQVESR